MGEFTRLMNIKLLSFNDYDMTLGQVILFPVILIVGYILLGALVKLAAKALNNRDVNPDVVQVVKRAIYIVGLIILFITALDLLNVPLTAFAFVSGAVAIGVGFGAQNIINNFISGWILMWERPIRINDFIEVGETSGTVEEINTRSTRIRRVDGVPLLIPNAKLLEESVVNWTLVDKLLRCIVRVGVQYGSDTLAVREALKKITADHPLVLDEPLPQVIFEDFGDSALIFDTYFWVNSVGDKSAREIRSDVRFAIEQAFSEQDIVVAFPQTDVHIDGNITLDSGS